VTSKRRAGAELLRRVRAVAIASLIAPLALAADYRVTAEQPTVLYDGPSAKAKPLFLYGRDVPVEVIVIVEGWAKVRDAGGTIGWIDRKVLSEKRMVVVRTPLADVRASGDDSAPLVFRAERDVLLELAEPASSSSSTAVPGWVKVRHRDGASGFIRITQVFGL
jgi:SH3-like domain-containing protein